MLVLVAGVLTNVVMVSLFEWLTMQVFPLPPGAATDPVRLDAVLQKAPLMVFAGGLAGVLVAALAAGAVSARVADQPRRIALVVGVLLVVANVANSFGFYHPLWFRVVAGALPLPLAVLAGRLGERPEPRLSPPKT